MNKKKAISLFLTAVMTANLLFVGPQVQIAADTTGGGTDPAKLDVTKTVEWDPDNPNEAKIVITSDVPDVDETQVLFLGSLCTRHSMDSTSGGGLDTISKTINALAQNADVTYRLFQGDANKDNVNNAHGVYAKTVEDPNKDAVGVVKRGDTLDITPLYYAGQHYVINGFAEELIKELSSNDYDYIVMEFDSSRVAGQDLMPKSRMDNVANLMKTYYEQNKVIWITDGAGVDDWNLEKSARYAKTPYVPSNFYYKSNDDYDVLLSSQEFKALCSVMAPSYYLAHANDNSVDIWGEEYTGGNFDAHYIHTERGIANYPYSVGAIVLDDSYSLKLGVRDKIDKINGTEENDYKVYSSDSRQMYYKDASELADFLYMAIQGTTLKFEDTINVSDSDSIKVKNVKIEVTKSSSMTGATWLEKATLNVEDAAKNNLKEDPTTLVKYVSDDGGEISVNISNTGTLKDKNNQVTLNVVDLKHQLKFVKVEIIVTDTEGFDSCIYLNMNEEKKLIDLNGELLKPGDDPVYLMNPNNGPVDVNAYKNGRVRTGTGDAYGSSAAKVPALEIYHVKGTVEGGTQSYDKDHGYLVSADTDPYVEIATYETDTPVYTFTPKTNYQLESITIDGKTVTLDKGEASDNTSGYEYEVTTSSSGAITVKFPKISNHRTVDVKFVYHNLVITKTIVSPAFGAAKGGDTITYKITVTNSGSVTESNFKITDVINTTKVKYKDSTPNAGYDDDTGTVTWSNLTLASGKSLDLLLEVEVLKTIEGEDKVSNSAGGFYPNNTPIPTAPAVDQNLLGRDVVIKYHVSGATPTGGNQKPNDATEIYGKAMSPDNKAAQAITSVDGYTFTGWYLNENLTGDPFNPDTLLNSTNYSVLENGDTLDLYGKWTVNMDFSVEKIVTYKGSEIGPNDYIAPGSTVTYTIKVTNNNKFVDIPNVKVTDTVPDNGLVIDENSFTDGGSLSSGVITWSVLVEAGKTKELKFNATVPADLTVEKSYKNVVSVPSADGTSLTGITDDVTFKAKPEDITLSVVKIWSDGWDEHTSDTVYVQLYRKTSAQVDWEKVANAEFALTSSQTSASISTARYTDSGVEYEFMFRELDASGGNIIDEGGVLNGYKVSYSIDAADERQTNITNTYIITKDDIEFTKTADSVAVPGEEFEYSLTVKNTRTNVGEVATNIVVTDTLPEGVSLVTPDGLVCTPGTAETSNDTAVPSNNDRDITWTVEKLAAGDTAKLTIKVIADSALTNVQIANEAKITTVGETVYKPGEMPRASALTDVRVFEVNKVWSDAGTTHKEVSVQLLQNGVEYGSPITLSDSNGWTYKWVELPVYDINKVRYVYTVKEIAVDGYSSDIDYSGDVNGNVAAKVTNTLKTYVIKYEFVGTDIPGGISVPNSDTVDWGTKYNSADKPSHNDYVFAGWFTDEECTTPYVDGTVIDDTTAPGGGKVLYGKWTKKVEVSYKFVGDTPTTATVPDGALLVPGTAYVADSKTKSIDDCTFEGWFIDEECTQKYVDGTQITKDTILYGKWTDKPEVSYNFVGDVPKGQTVPGSEYVPLGSPYDADKTTGSITDYDFDGWYLDPECTQKYVDGTQITKDTILYGNWTVHPEVSYKFVGDVPKGQTVPASERVAPGTEYNADSTTKSTQEYTFDGWYLDPECTQKYVDGTPINSDTVLYGNWTKNPEVSYTFVGVVPEGQKVPDSAVVKAGSPYNADKTTKSTDDYTFDGWYLDPECTQKYTDGTEIDEDTVLYGKWNKNPEVSYTFVGDVPKGQKVPESDVVTPGTPYDSDKTTKSIKDYVFDGWYLDPECTQKYTDGTEIDKDTVLYGNWTENPVVSYVFVGDVPGGKTVPNSEHVGVGTKYTPSSVDVPEIYEFDGWYTDPGCTQKFVPGTPIDKDTILYGNWVKKEGAVEHLPGLGSAPNPTAVSYPDDFIITVGEVIPVPKDPTYNGDDYTFTGWFSDPECTIPYVPTVADESGIEIYAGWSYNPVVTYTFVGKAPDGVSVPAGERLTAGATYTTTSPEGKTETYTFDGWYTDAACTQKFVEGTQIFEDTVLYGKWVLVPIATRTGESTNNAVKVAAGCLIIASCVITAFVLEDKKKHNKLKDNND